MDSKLVLKLKIFGLQSDLRSMKL